MSDMSEAQPTDKNPSNEIKTPEKFSGDKHHGGSAGIEFPVERFDSSLSQAVENNKILSLEDHGVLTHDELLARSKLLSELQTGDTKKSRTKVIALAGGAAALFIAGAALFMPKDDAESVPITSDSAPTTEVEQDTTTTTLAAAPEVVPSSEYGNIDIAYSATVADEVISATRPNGEIIEVSKLADLSDLNRFGESALGLLACYMTTASEACLTEFSLNTGVQDAIRDIRQQIFVDPYQAINLPTEDNFQMTIFDSSASPAEFVYGVEPNYVTLTGGSVIFQFSDDEQWQGTNSSNDWFSHRLTQFELLAQENDAGDAEILDIRIRLESNQ